MFVQTRNDLTLIPSSLFPKCGAALRQVVCCTLLQSALVLASGAAVLARMHAFAYEMPYEAAAAAAAAAVAATHLSGAGVPSRATLGVPALRLVKIVLLLSFPR